MMTVTLTHLTFEWEILVIIMVIIVYKGHYKHNKDSVKSIHIFKAGTKHTLSLS